MSRERPILFSAPMVRAILEGRKTQTRRVVKPQPEPVVRDAGVITSSTNSVAEGAWWWLDSTDIMDASVVGEEFRCPYGIPGDRLWVRETWAKNEGTTGGVCYRSDVGECAAFQQIAKGEVTHAVARWRPSIHMPRWASRITLKVTGFRVERLQDISEDDARAEGCDPVVHADGMVDCGTRKTTYRALWDSINGKPHIERDNTGREVARHDYSWAANPWVWVVEFQVLRDAREANAVAERERIA